MAEHQTELVEGFDNLNPRQVAFVYAYARHFNATRAAIEAGYSPESARNQGPRLMKDDGVREAVRRVLDEAVGEKEMLVQRVYREAQRIAFSDPGDFFEVDDEGQVRIVPLDEMDADARAALGEVVQTTTELGENVLSVSLKVKREAKAPALALLAKATGIVDANRSDDRPPVTVNLIIEDDDDDEPPTPPQAPQEPPNDVLNPRAVVRPSKKAKRKAKRKPRRKRKVSKAPAKKEQK